MNQNEHLLRDGFIILRGILNANQLRSLEMDAQLALQIQWEEHSDASALVQSAGCIIPCHGSDLCPSQANSMKEYWEKERIHAGFQDEDVAGIFDETVLAWVARALTIGYGHERDALDTVFLYNEQFVCKPVLDSLDSAFDVHQDREYDREDKWMEREGCVALWAPLFAGVNRERGALCMVPRSEEERFYKFLRDNGAGHMTKLTLVGSRTICERLLIGEQAPHPDSGARLLVMEPGDVVLFTDDVWHWSLPNRGTTQHVGHLTLKGTAPVEQHFPRVAWMAQFSASVVRSRRRGGAPACLAVPLRVPSPNITGLRSA